MNKETVKHLNIILANELTAINQYFMHAKLLKHQGFMKLAAKEQEESIDEMKHADQLMDRILYLGGMPNIYKINKINIGQTPKAMLEADLAEERSAIKDLQKAIAVSNEAEDHGTSELLESILVSEESHVEWLETQLRLINSLGEKNYLQGQI